MIRNMKTGVPNLFKKGSVQLSGKVSTVEKSIEAVVDMKELMQTSFGPFGSNKIIINRLDKISITSDAASILNDLEVNHPVAKIVVLAAKMQEKEIGDGSNLVMIFAGELCKAAGECINDGVEINDIVSGLKKAHSSLDAIAEKLSTTPSPVGDIKSHLNAIRTALSSKAPGDAALFADLVVQAYEAVSFARPGEALPPFDVDRVQVCSVPGGALADSSCVRGLAFEEKLLALRNADLGLADARVVAFNSSVDTQCTETKGVALLESAEQLLSFNAGEEARTERLVGQLKALGVTLVLTGGAFGDMALHYMAQNGIAGLKVQSKFDLMRAVKLVGCRAIPLWGDAVTKEDTGFCRKVLTRVIGSKALTLLEQDEADSKLATVLIRGSSENVRNIGKTAVDDGVNAIKTLLRDPRVVPGGGAAELSMAKEIRERCLSKTDNGESLLNPGVEAFCTALEAIPGILAKSCGLDAYKTTSILIAAHAKGSESSGMGVSVLKAEITDMTEIGVFDLTAAKLNALRLATDVVCTLLLIDHIIMAKPAGGPKPGKKAHWDED